MGTLLDALRAHTADDHARLDAALPMQDGRLSPEVYAGFLRASAAAVSQLEPAVARWMGPPADGRARATALAADLESLGLGDAPPLAVEVPQPRDRMEALGAAYVMEGSALGGLVLARRVAEAIPGATTHYLTLRGPETRAHWRAFMERLGAEGDAASEAERARATAFARETFQAYSRAFEAVGLLPA